MHTTTKEQNMDWYYPTLSVRYAGHRSVVRHVARDGWTLCGAGPRKHGGSPLVSQRDVSCRRCAKLAFGVNGVARRCPDVPTGTPEYAERKATTLRLRQDQGAVA